MGTKGKHWKHTEEHKKRRSIWMMSNKHGEGNKGKVIPEKVRKKISNSVKKLFKENPEYREKIKRARAKQKVVYESKHEKLIQKGLTKLGIEFKKHRYMKEIKHAYQCDIFIEPNIVIEIDGEYWHNRPETKSKDLIRTKEMQEKGFVVLRISALTFLDKNYKVNHTILNKFIEVIKNEIK